MTTDVLDVDVATLGDFAEAEAPADACVNYGECRNVVPGRGQMCGDCLDKARRNSRDAYDV